MNSNLVVNWVNILQAAPACVPLTGIGIGVICIWFGGWLRWDRWKFKTDTRFNNNQIQVISEAGSKLSILFSLVVVGGKVVVVVFLSFFFPFLSVFGFLVALGSFGSLFFFLSFFFFLSSSGALLTRPKISGKKGGKRSGREREREVFQSPLLTVLSQNLLKWKHIPPCIQKLKTQLVLLWGLGLRLCNYFFTASHCSVSKESPDCQLHFSGCLRSISISFWLFLKSCGTFMETMFLSFH